MVCVAKWLLLALGLVVVAGSATALKCWDCMSDINRMCGDPMNISEHQATFRIKDCESTHYHTPKPVCRKLVERHFGERVITRSCYTPGPDEVDIVDGPCNPVTSGHTVVESCHICSTDRCNSATDISATLALYLGALALGGYRFLQSKNGVL